MILRNFVLLSVLLIYGCDNHQSDRLFSLMNHTGVSFTNTLTYDEQVNTYTFKNFYNGGGVGVGDLDNDGLPELFFCGSQVESRLYKNAGDFSFEDITIESNINTKDVWVTGVSLVDVNGDGLLDIYLCKSGPPNGANRRNSLYINLGNLKFEDRAEQYGLDNLGLSSHAAFFDYDQDGDLDCYLLNNSIRSVGAYDYKKGLRNEVDTLGGNKLFRNDNGVFVDATTAAGIYSSAIGFGLGVTITDFNDDSWPDIYVSNDFFERDYLYVNNKNGTFREDLVNRITELSMGSMGADIADVNNDGLEEIFVTEMLPDRHDRLKTKAQFEKWDKYQLSIENGYHRQFGRNAFQLNNGNGTYSEVSRLSDMEATDWSWGALIFDMDNDGYKDIFIANGINKDLLDQDYINFSTDPNLIRSMIKKEEDAIKNLIDMIPTEALPNYAYKNTNGVVFSSNAQAWGLDKPSFSNGSAYGDFDGDGDLDLVINNINQEAFIYRNNSDKTANKYLTIKLIGDQKNPFAIGASMMLHVGDKKFSQELYPARGFQSSVDYTLVFGLGDIAQIDSVTVMWPTGETSKLQNVQTNNALTFNINNAQRAVISTESEDPSSYLVKGKSLQEFRHIENEYVDFDKERLLFEMNSAKGPCACVGDVNKDGLDDFFVGGAWGTDAYLAIQTKSGSFRKLSSLVTSKSENISCEFVDYNRDGNLDLLIGNGGSEANDFSLQLRDELYVGNGKGDFELAGIPFLNNKLNVTGVIKSSAWSGDDQYIFIGGSQVPGTYGINPSSYILKNDAVLVELHEEFRGVGLVTDAAWGDLDNDGDEDLIVVGNWMSPLIFTNNLGKFQIDTTSFLNQNGLYNAVKLYDIDNDGDLDVFLGNEGLNTRYEATTEKPLRMYVGDMDGNGKTEQIISQYFGNISYPILQLKDLLMQVPVLKKKYLRYSDYKDATFDDLLQMSKTRPIIHQVEVLEHQYYINTDSGFIPRSLPIEAQFSSINALAFSDVNSDGVADLLVGGNDYRIKPEWGINASTYGQLFLGDGQGHFKYVNQKKSGLNISGEIRQIKKIMVGEEENIIFVRNNDYPVLMKKR